MIKEKFTISVSELGQYLGIGRSLAYQLSRQQDFPVVRIGKRVLIPIEGLKLWMNKNFSNEGE